MKFPSLTLVTILAVTLIASQSPGQVASRDRLPNFDKRSTATAAGPDQRGEADALRAKVANLRVDFDPVTGSPKSVAAAGSFLSGANAPDRLVSAASLAAFPADDPHRATKAFLKEHAKLFGHGPEALDSARLTRDYVTPNNGLHTAVWQQQVDNIPVFEAVLISHTTKRGELATISSQFVPDPASAADRGAKNRAALVASPAISVQQAIAAAARNLGDKVAAPELAVTGAAAIGAERKQHFTTPALKGETDAQLTWLPMDRQTLRLCWDITLTSRTRNEMFRMLVDASTGEILLRRSLTAYLTDATYNVFTSDSPSPFSPGWPTPQSGQPALVTRTLVTLPAMDTNASLAGWLDDGANETRGNNVDAHTDWNNDDLPDLPRPQGSPFRVFDFPMNLGNQNPTNYASAAVVQLFYLCNWYHDKLYELGFTEAAGNFQSNNFSRGGFGNDAVQADAQDGSGTDNANFSTPSDGSPGRMQMYIFSGPSPRRDGDLDAEIVFHEHTHGLSWRLVGGGQALGDTQSDGMGEGWSDFYGLCLLSEAGDDVNGNYAAGGYATYQLSGLTQNYYYGIRRYPYSTDMTKNPLTFKDIDPAQASSHSGIPKSPVIGGSASEVHNEGEVWCVTLWDARANLINKYGWAVGNQLILQLVTDGMKLTVPHPNFLQARDAILQADMVDTGGANQNELWAAFAKRGMGFSASSPASSTTTGLIEAYDLPDPLRIGPLTGFDSAGQIGGPFIPSCLVYYVTNTGSTNLTWSATVTQPWITLSTNGGTLTNGEWTSITACFDVSVNGFGAGVHSASLIFSNLLTERSFSRNVSLSILPPSFILFSFDSDPGWTRQGAWAFGQPAGSGGAAHGNPDPASGFTGTNVFGYNLNGDYSAALGGPYYLTTTPIDCSMFTNVTLQFRRWLNTDYQPYVYATIEVSTNGTSWSSVWNNGTAEIVDSTWTRVSYDISALADKAPAVYVRWSHRVAQTGAYAYSGWNLDDVEFLGTPTGALNIFLPGSAAEDSGVLAGAGTVRLGTLLPTNLDVSLSSSDPTRLVVPPQVTIPAGQYAVSFDLTLLDNSLQDGNELITITATSDLTNATKTLLVTDDDTSPSIIGQPASVAVNAGSSASFTINALGKAPLSYFWRRDGDFISGANGISYTTNNVQAADSGSQFTCVITNLYGAVTSSPATLTVISGPSNDVCSLAVIILTTNFTISQSTANATTTGDPQPSCIQGGSGKGLWYQFTALDNGSLTVDTIGSSFDTTLGIYSGVCGALTQVGCDDDSGGNLNSSVTVPALAGTTYYVLAGGWNATAPASGNLIFHLKLSVTSPPPVIIAQSNLVIALDKIGARVSSALYRGAEIYRVAPFISDWGLETGTNSVTFVRNANSGNVTGQRMTLLSSNATSATFTGTYTNGGGNVAIMRSYALVPGFDLLRVLQTFTNNGASEMTLRCFDTYDPDWSLGATNFFYMSARRYSITSNGVTLQIGRGVLTNNDTFVLLGTPDPNAVLAASDASYLGVQSFANLDTLFSNGGADSGDAFVDESLDVAREFTLSAGSSASFVFYQSFATNLVAAEDALIRAAGAPTLDIAFSSSNVVLSWPAAGLDFVLETTPDLQSGTWSAVSAAPSLSADVYSLSLPGETNAFYRLRYEPH